ncbi:hypothetical protein PYW07_001582 [Mythimna separata]|uniref:Putative ionotropic receptor ligand binding domain-containing protein n=1 Tax=Mythimna separata TaxID=271217 RepID=A0AAD7YU64_MYTSE|nr:hypothetical protein PYW07_001582 [Mythimna separata]
MDVGVKEPENHTIEDFITDDPASELGLLAAKVAYYNFEWRFLTIVMFNTVQGLGLNTFLMHYQQSVIVKLGRFLPEKRAAVPQLVIFGEDSSDVSSTLRWTVRSKYDSNGKFIIICALINQDCDEQKIFQTLQSLLIFNVVLLKTSLKTKRAQAYSYDFITKEKCKNNVPYKLNLSTACENDTCFKDLYPEKLSNFQKCRLRMSTVEQAPFMYLHNGTRSPSGIDGDLMRLAANMLNATLELLTPADGLDAGHFTNGNWTGSLGDIYNGLRHASVCSSPLTSNKYGNFQISFPYYSMDIVWATRLPTQKASWEKLLNPLNIYLRIILFLLFISIVFMNTICTLKVWRQVREAFKIEPPKYSFLFFSWVLFLGLPILREPERKSFLITIYTWIWFCFVIRSAYQAALINSLKQPAYHDNLETFQDVIRERFPYGGLTSLKEYYTDDREIYDNWVVVDNAHLYETLDNILDGTTDFVLASNKEAIKHHLMRYKGTKQLQIIPQKIVNSPTVVYYKRFSPLTVPLNNVLRIALEGGFIQRIHDKYLDHDKKLFRRVYSTKPEPLTMNHFTGSFVLLILGWFVSATYFAVEYVCGNLED